MLVLVAEQTELTEQRESIRERVVHAEQQARRRADAIDHERAPQRSVAREQRAHLPIDERAQRVFARLELDVNDVLAEIESRIGLETRKRKRAMRFDHARAKARRKRARFDERPQACDVERAAELEQRVDHHRVGRVFHVKPRGVLGPESIRVRHAETRCTHRAARPTCKRCRRDRGAHNATSSAMLSETIDWVRRARRVIPREDRRVLLSPPRLVARFARFALARHAGRAGSSSADDVRARDPELVEALLDLYRVLAKYYFRLRVSGVENVPETGPVLLVGNHNGGLLPSEGFFTALAIYERYGVTRAVYALAHDFIFEDPLLRRYAARLGMLRAKHESAHHAFAVGACVIVYPGSDLDTFRTFRDRNRVVLGGRKGFLKLALRERVPIVPVVTAGAHEQLIVLSRGDKLARLLHAHAWARTEVLPIVLSFPWGLTSGFVPYLPLPAQASLAFGAPMSWPDLGPSDADNPTVLDRCYREVEARMQCMLDELSAGRHFLVGPSSRRANA